MKKLLFLGLGLSLIGSLAACGFSTVEASETYVLVEINPKIEFTVDDDDIEARIQEMRERAAERFNEYQEAYQERQDRREDMRP